MSKEAEIRMNFRKACAQAEKLEDMARELQRLARERFGETLDHIDAAWDGESAGLYIQKGRGLQDGICQDAGELQRIARIIREIAENTYRAEMRNLELARKREF